MEHLRNVAIIAHVDHGKTTLVDQLLRQSGQFRDAELDKLKGGQHGLIMDSDPLERERGITILSKNCAVNYHDQEGRDYRINIIDTPGHADFGGEVERVLRMADGCMLVVDAFEGPMPQTRFVLGKALELGLRPVVMINKCDRAEADPHRVVDELLSLFIELGADDDTLDFPVVYGSARDGWATDDMDVAMKSDHGQTNLRDVFELIVRHVPSPKGEVEAPLQMLVTTLDYSGYVGRIGIGRVYNGKLRKGEQVMRITRPDRDGKSTRHTVKVGQLYRFEGLGRTEVDEIEAGDLCAVVGLDQVDIGDTLADADQPEALPPVKVDEPTLTMVFRVNSSPFAGQEGEYVTSRQIKDRLDKELQSNVALRVEPGDSADEFIVSGRGLLHLGILLENMRREGYELAVGKPRVIEKEIDGVKCEPVEELVIDVPTEQMGAVMELCGARKGETLNVEPRGPAMTHIVYKMTSRALIGLRGRVMTSTQGEAIMHHTLSGYEPISSERFDRPAGVIIATESGQVTPYAVSLAHDRGVLFVKPGDKVYAGQIVGEHNRPNDITLNIVRQKKLDNMRSANKEATVTLKAPRDKSLEESLEYIEEDELVELTPTCIRIRKIILDEGMRRRAERQARDKAGASS
ncbi:MAG: translational GTPase TypA [Phycisphaera sp.]|nr:MAG: translational GTPase TypA [Phycisphaera sp.]